MNLTKEEFNFILQEGEGYKIEFKESLNNIDKKLVAFANAPVNEPLTEPVNGFLS